MARRVKAKSKSDGFLGVAIYVLLAFLHYVGSARLLDVKYIGGRPHSGKNALRESDELPFKKNAYMKTSNAMLNIKMRTNRSHIQTLRIHKKELQDFACWIIKPIIDWLHVIHLFTKLLILQHHFRESSFRLNELLIEQSNLRRQQVNNVLAQSGGVSNSDGILSEVGDVHIISLANSLYS